MVCKAKKTEKLQASVTEEEMIAVQEQAEIEGLSVSQLLRKTLRNYLHVMGYRLMDVPQKAQDSSESQIAEKKRSVFKNTGRIWMM